MSVVLPQPSQWHCVVLLTHRLCLHSPSHVDKSLALSLCSDRDKKGGRKAKAGKGKNGTKEPTLSPSHEQQQQQQPPPPDDEFETPAVVSEGVFDVPFIPLMSVALQYNIGRLKGVVSSFMLYASVSCFLYSVTAMYMYMTIACVHYCMCMCALLHDCACGVGIYPTVIAIRVLCGWFMHDTVHRV